MKRKIFSAGLVFAAALGLMAPAVAGPGSNQLPSNDAKTVPKSNVARRVGVDEFERLWQDKKPVLDVRTKKEFEGGHIPGSVNLDVDSTAFIQWLYVLDNKKLCLR